MLATVPVAEDIKKIRLLLELIVPICTSNWWTTLSGIYPGVCVCGSRIPTLIHTPARARPGKLTAACHDHALLMTRSHLFTVVEQSAASPAPRCSHRTIRVTTIYDSNTKRSITPNSPSMATIPCRGRWSACSHKLIGRCQPFD